VDDHDIVDATGACLRALLRYGVPPDREVIVKAVEWLLNGQDENGEFVDFGGPWDVQAGVVVTLCEWLEAVQRAGKEDELRDLVERVENALKRAIDPLVSEIHEYGDYDDMRTALATYALLKCAELGLIDPNHETIVKGLEALYNHYAGTKSRGAPYYWYWPGVCEEFQTWTTAYVLAAFVLAEKLGVGKTPGPEEIGAETEGGKGVPLTPAVVALALAALPVRRR